MSLPSVPKVGEKFIDGEAKLKVIGHEIEEIELGENTCSNKVIAKNDILFQVYAHNEVFEIKMPYWFFEQQFESGVIVPE